MTNPSPQPASRQFETQIGIAAPRDAVWKALAEGPEIERWFAAQASIEPRLGGKLVWRWQGHHTWTHTIEAWQPGERLLTRYDSEVDDGRGGKQPLFVDFRLSGQGGSTTLRLVQSGFGPEASFDREYDGISHGWPVELRSLRLYLERHRGKPRTAAWLVHPTGLSPEKSWEVLTGDDGLGCGAALDRLQEGAPFALATREGDRLSGQALCCHRREFSGVVTNLDDAWVRLVVETWQGPTKVWFQVSTYGEPEADRAARVARLHGFLTRLFPATVAAEKR